MKRMAAILLTIIMTVTLAARTETNTEKRNRDSSMILFHGVA